MREKHWLLGGLVLDAIPAFFAMVGTALVTYVASWAGWFASDKGYFRHWAEENGHAGDSPILNALRSLWHYHQEAYSFHVGLDSEHTYQANPFGWLLQIRPTNFYYRSYDYGEAGCQVAKCGAQILSVGNPLIWWLGTIAVHLRTEEVERAHVMAARDQLVGQMRADEARSAGDQNVHLLTSPLARECVAHGVALACACPIDAR